MSYCYFSPPLISRMIWNIAHPTFEFEIPRCMLLLVVFGIPEKTILPVVVVIVPWKDTLSMTWGPFYPSRNTSTIIDFAQIQRGFVQNGPYWSFYPASPRANTILYTGSPSISMISRYLDTTSSTITNFWSRQCLGAFRKFVLPV